RQYAWQRTHLDYQEIDRRRTMHRILDYYLSIAERAVDTVYPFHRKMDTELIYAPTILPSLNTRSDFRKWMESEQANILSIIHYAARSGWQRYAILLPHVVTLFLDTWGYWEDAIALHRLAVRASHET